MLCVGVKSISVTFQSTGYHAYSITWLGCEHRAVQPKCLAQAQRGSGSGSMRVVVIAAVNFIQDISDQITLVAEPGFRRALQFWRLEAAIHWDSQVDRWRQM